MWYAISKSVKYQQDINLFLLLLSPPLDNINALRLYIISVLRKKTVILRVDVDHVQPLVMANGPMIVDRELAADERLRRVAEADVIGDRTKTMPGRLRVLLPRVKRMPILPKVKRLPRRRRRLLRRRNLNLRKSPCRMMNTWHKRPNPTLRHSNLLNLVR